MIRQYLFQFLLVFASAIQLLGEEAKPAIDRIEVEGGAVLTGQIIESGAEDIQLETDYAGVITVKTSRVERIVTQRTLAESVPSDLIVVSDPVVVQKKASSGQPDPEETQPPGEVAQTQQDKAPVATKSPPAKQAAKPAVKVAATSRGPTKPPTKPPVKEPPAKKPAPTNDKYGWEVEAGMNLSGNAGNSEKLDLGLNVDTQYEQKFYRVDLYARYSYGTNRDRLTSNEIVLGSRYTNFFYKKFGFFIREELEHDKFEAIDIRSTTASGFSYKFYDTRALDLEASMGLSYRFEKDDRNQEEDYPGMDFGVNVQWKFNPYLSFKGKYAFIPSFRDSEAFIITQNSGIDIPFDRKSAWKIRLGLTTKYNNQPKRNRENMDHKFYARLIATWK